MGGTVMSYPQQYLKVYEMIRKGWKSAANLQVRRALQQRRCVASQAAQSASRLHACLRTSL